MKSIILVSFVAIFLLSCGNSQRSEYISSCLAETPGGASYEELCACSYDGGIELMTPEERTAFGRNFSEIQDAQYAFTGPMKFIAAQQDCLADIM